MQIQMGVKYYYSQAFSFSFLFASDKRQRYEVIAPECDGNSAGSRSLFGNILRTFKGVVARIYYLESCRNIGEIQFGGYPTIVF